ncbi:class I SAM-dependent methyltransferase [Microbacteriaceae bacterium 4G12]
MNFFDEKNKHSYTTREADVTWVNAIRDVIDVTEKEAVDIGCGGGIYSRTLLEMGVKKVTGVDFSKAMLEGAREYCQGISNISFQEGTALATELPDESCDIVLERALIHHLRSDELQDCFLEAHRILRKDGAILIQDRTPEDCLQPGSPQHLRGYFFEKFPSLAEKEIKRRHTSSTVITALLEAGFQEVKEVKLWETRKVYNSVADMQYDLLTRTGRSLLHELSDANLASLTDYIGGKVREEGKEEIEEKDCWTIWYAKKDVSR